MVHIKKKNLKKKEWVWVRVRVWVRVWVRVCARACACVPTGTHIGWGDQTVQRKKKKSNGKRPDSSTKASGCPSFGNKHKSSMAALKKAPREDETPHSPTLL